MTQEQKKFIIKALEAGIPAIAQDHIRALEEIGSIESAKDGNGATEFKTLTPTIYENTVSVIAAVYPFMSDEFITAYAQAINTCYDKFKKNAPVSEEIVDANEGVVSANSKKSETVK